MVNAPIDPFTAGQFAKLALEIDGERVQRAYSYVNAPDDANLEFYLVTVPEGKLSPRLNQLRPGSDVMVTKEAAGFFVLDEVPDCDTLWMLATGTAIGPYIYRFCSKASAWNALTTWCWCTPRVLRAI
ncbi:Ferredoxin--NADP reductase [Serratia marcescens]|uniref:Ferredoxin--NADP reductase n=1 Tax=Serratia marcescens TaxID=615 RepID=A0A379Y9E5_SERMA|nr:Ferredoxin--NADP reductase [Serratia marcescens]